MLHWLHKNVSKKAQVWLQLVLVSTIMHSCVLCMLLFYRDRNAHTPITLHKDILQNGVPVVVLAHKVPVAAQQKQSASLHTTSNQIIHKQTVTQVQSKPQPKPIAKPPAKTTTVVKSQPKSDQKVAKKQEAKKIATVTSTSAQVKKEPIKKELPEKKVAQKEIPKIVKKEPINKQQAKESKIAQDTKQKNDTKKVAEQQVQAKVQTKEKIEQKQVQEIIQAQKETITAKVPVLHEQKSIIKADTHHKQTPLINAEKGSAQLINTHNAHLINGPIIVAKDYREKIMLKKHHMLQQELVRVWHPPVGVNAGRTCQMRVSVTQDGVVRGIDIIASSGILMFDVAARSALHAAKLPKWTWGTSFDITFS